MLSPYTVEIETQMQTLYKRLSEKSRRLYAGVEALKLPRGGVSYIARLLGCSRDTVLRGIKELKAEESVPAHRSRKVGGGRTPVLEKCPVIHEVFVQVIKDHTAGEPMDEAIKWTHLTTAEIIDLLAEKGLTVSREVVRKLLKEHGYVKRKALKKSHRSHGES